VTRPVIGVTLGDGDRKGYHAMREDYVRSVEAAGAVPLVLPTQEPGAAEAILDRLDGLVLSGGIDVDPALYGCAPHPKLGRVDRARDEFEIALTRLALQRDLPLFAICRGQQLLNVATGGTLVQDIPSVVAGAVAHDAPGRRTRRSHAVEVAPGSRLAEILGPGPLLVNSFHHQSIDRLGLGLEVTGRSPGDGVIEAVEMKGRSFVVGVQWHPESFWNETVSFKALFEAHVEACRAASPVRVR
jgi:putative glutamine amidotransferase